MKRTKLRKQSKAPISKIQRQLWLLCKQIIRILYPPICYTCDAPISGKNDHTSHLIPKAACGAYLKFDLRNLRRTCYRCNIHLGGNAAEFYIRMVRREGKKYVDELMRDKQKTVKAYDFYLKLLEEYKLKLESLKNAEVPTL